MSSLIVPSIEFPNIRYRVTSELPQDSYFYGRASTYPYGAWFDTMGDGNTAHTPDRVLEVRHIADFAASVLTYLHSPEGRSSMEAWDTVASGWPRNRMSRQSAFFLAGIVYTPERPEWIEVNACKRSKSQDKEFDKRWRRVPSWMDGTMKGILDAMFLDESASQTIDKIVRALHTREWHHQPDTVINSTFIGLGEDYEAHTYAVSAVDALNRAIEGHRLIESSKRSLECRNSNLAFNRERVA